MSHLKVIRVSLLLLLICAFPLIASAATTDFRILFDVDHDTATGCTVSTMPGVDHVFTTRVDTTTTTAAVTQTFRQVCIGGSLGPQIAVSSTGWPAGFQTASGELLVETRIPFEVFPDSTMPRNMRVGLVASQGSSVHTALTRPSGEQVFFPAPSKGRRRAVSAPGVDRAIILDGIGTDWNGLKSMFEGIAAGGVPGLRILKFLGFADTNNNHLYFRFDVNTSNSAPLAVPDFYTRQIGSGLTVPGVNGDPTVLENDSDPNGLPLTATLVSPPSLGSVVLDENGGFTYTPTDPNSEEDDSFDYRASNGTQSSNTATVTIAAQEVEVSGPNQEPSFNVGADPTVLEDAGPQSLVNWATGITAGPDEDDDQTVQFVVTGVTNPSLFDDPPSISANGTLTFTPANDAFGFATVTVKLVDDGGTLEGGDNESPSQSFVITVDEVNDAPSFNAGAGIIVEDNDGAQNLPWATAILAGPLNESSQTVNFTLTNDNPALFSVQPTIAPNGTITFTPAPGQTGFANLSVVLHDDGGTANGGIDTSAPAPLIITVEKAPLVTSANNTTFTVGTAGSFTVTTSGIPRPSIAIGGVLPAGITFVDGTGANKGTGVLSGTPAPGTGGTYALTFTASNVRGSSPVQNFTLTINQPPAITSNNLMGFTRNQPFTHTITTTGFPVPALSFTGTLPTGVTFVDNGNGTATVSGTPTDPGNHYQITVTASNGVGANAIQSVDIFVFEKPTFTSANSTQFSAGVTANFTVTTTGFPEATLSATGTLPAGITFTNNAGTGTATLGGTAIEGSGGVYPIIITATNGSGSTQQNFTITVCNTIAVINPVVSAGTVGQAFSQSFTQTGAVGTATFTTASTLPAGLTLAANGVLSGTPSQLGSFPITVTVTDANGCSGTGGTYTLVIGCQTITVNNPANANGTAGSAFSETFTETNAIGGATFSLASGTLPAGVTLAANGVLSGTPTQTGSFPITVAVTDGNGCTGTGLTYTLVIGCQTITVNNPANANGTAASAFSETFTQTGAIGTPVFTLATGTLPAGLTLAANGVLSGTPTQVGSFPITVSVTDGNGCSGTSATYTIVIGCQVINVTSPANTNGTVSAAFSETFTQTGAIGTATFTTASALPAGLTLATNGVLSGTPTQTGSFPITVTVTDANGCMGTSGTYTLVIGCQTITVTNPANTNATVASAFSETFTQSGSVGTATFTTASTLPAGITLAANGVLSGIPTQSGTFPVTVTVTDANGCTGTSTTYTLVVVCQVITVNNPANANGTANAAFSETFTQTGAIGTATFTTASTLPTGITLATNGVLSGTPTQTGTFPITVIVTDDNGCTGTSATYTLVIGCQTITVTNPANANGTANAAFSETFTQTGAIGTATFTLASGTLPTGLTLAANGVLAGTPTQTGSFPITVTATDANGCTGTSTTYTLVIGCQTITVTNPANANGTANAAFSETFTQTGSIGTATFTLASGTLPAGLTLAANGVLSGTPTQTGSFPITVTVTDGNGCTGTSSTYTIVIACQTITVTNPANTNGTVSAAFSETFTQSGAIGTATFTTASTLPAGLTLATNGVLSGTPTQTGSFPIVVTITDANGCTGTSSTYTLVIACQTITVTNPANANGTISAAFSETFTQTAAVGTATFTTASTLPAGLTLATNGVLSGTPTQTGTFPIVVTVTDSNGCTGTSSTYTLVIACQTITVTNPANANGTAGSAFSETFTQSGAIGTATFTLASGTLPAGLTLASNGVLSGTPTQTGSFPITVTVTDDNSCTGTSSTYTLVIGCQTITVTNPANANGTANAAFSETFTETGSIGGATFTLASGTLPTGLTLAATGVLSGTPTQTGSFPITVTVTDGNGCTGTSSTYTIVIACQTITVTNPANANGTANAAFSETFTETGSIGTATFTLASGTLPAGLTLASNGVLSGTPTQTGSFPITVTVTDGNGCTGTSSTYTIVIGCQTITVTNPANANGTAGAAFSETFTQTGAIGTATFTLASGTLPAGLTLASNGVLAGTPTQTGSFPITVTVTDGNGCTGTSSTYTIVIGCQTITVTNPANANGTVSAAFSETFTQTGAIGTATFTLATGTLPAGLTLASNGVLAGTPTQTGSFPITVTVTDGNGCTGTSSTYTIVIACQTITVTNPANATGPAGSPFSETFSQSGAIGTATFTTASTLPAGLTLSSAGVLSGTPTEGGTFPIVVTVTDSNGCTGTSSTYNLIITCPVITVTSPANANGTAGAAFSETFTESGAQGGATFTLASGTLPSGLTLSTAGVLSGTPTQTGSFPITVTVTDGNGCTGTSSTYTLTIACQTITVTNPANANGTANAAFSETFTETGAIGTATFTLASGTLPAGITLAANGTLAGTPTQTGSFPITVTVTDGNGCTGTSSTYTLVIGCQTITVTNPANTNGTLGAAFSETFTETGSIGSATFTTASTLPAGITLSTAGVLSGTPTQPGTFPIVVTVTDVNGCTGTSATYTLVIACQTITVTDPANSNGTVGSAFSETFTQTGAIGTATFTTASTLPAGITLAANGVLSGTPTQSGSFPLTVIVTDSNSCTGTSTSYTLVIACQTITVTNPAGTAGTVDAAFSETFSQTGAIGTATFTLASGTLPSGLTLSSAGVLSGTPGQPGSFPITVTVTDSNGCTGTSATHTLVIGCQTITVTNPATSTGTVDAAFSQTFTQTGVGTHGPAVFSTTDPLPSGLTLSSAGVLSGTPGQPGTFPITVTVTDANGCSGTGTTYTLIIACQVITVTNPATTTATFGTAFSQTFTQTGVGTHGPAVFTTTDNLAGLTLSSAGVLSGTPTQTGTFPITVTVTDANSCTGTSSVYTLSVAPVAVVDSFSNAVNNTQYVLTGGTTATPSTPSVQVAGSISTNDLPSGNVTVVAGTFATANSGSVTIAADGTFLYTPPANPGVAALTSDSFTYTVTSNTGGTGPVTSAPGTVTINLANRVWYVKNNAAAGGNGQSQAPFNTLSSAQTASTANDFIFVYQGDGATTNQNSGFALKNGQKLLGEGVTLTVNGINLVTGVLANKPLIGNSGGAGVSGLNLTDVEIRGLNIGGSTDGINFSTSGANSGGVTIADNVIRSAGAEGIDIDGAGTGTFNISLHDVTVTSTGNGIDISRTAGTMNITAFDDNVITGTTGGTGINVVGVGGAIAFDAVPGVGVNTVLGGVTAIGSAGAGNGAGVSGMILNNVSGDLHFSNLNIFADAGTGLFVSGNGGMQLRVNTGGSDTGVIVATGGPAVDATAAALDLRLLQLTSTNSSSTGVSLANVTGTLNAPAGSSITNATGTDFNITTGTVDVSYAGTITDDVGQIMNISGSTGGTKQFSGAITDGEDTDGSGITLSSNTGTTIRFSGGLLLSTSTNPALAVTGGGTIEVCALNPCGGASTVINRLTTTTGIPLRVENTNFGANGLTFQRITSNGAQNGIRIDTTGASGFLTVTGTGVDDSGGTIANSTQDGVFLNSTRNITLTQMVINNSGQSQIQASTVVGLTLPGLETDDSGDHGILGTMITNLNISGAVLVRGGDNAGIANKHGVFITNLRGTSTVTNTTFSSSNTIQMFVLNNTATVAAPAAATDTLTVSGTTWNNHTGPFAGDHLSVQADTGGNFLLNVNSTSGVNTFTTGGIGVQATAGGSGTMKALITGVNSSLNTAGVVIGATASGNAKFDIFSNKTANGTGFSGTGSVAIAVTCITSGTCNGFIRDNTVTHTAGPGVDATHAILQGNGTMNVEVFSNVVTGNFQRGFYSQSGVGTGQVNMNFHNNSYTGTANAAAGALQGVYMENGSSAGGPDNKFCLDMAANSVTMVDTTAYRLRNEVTAGTCAGCVFQLKNYAGGGSDTTAISNWITNPPNSNTFSTASGTPISIGTNNPYTSSAGCTAPTL